jgi:4-diphosphocytidyl-2-C-methyl-D-erythritol kinase
MSAFTLAELAMMPTGVQQAPGVEQQADHLQVWAPAKVNLYLEVLARRDDGYHDIATAMLTVCLYDTLAFQEEPSGTIVLQCTDPTLSTGEENLITRAARLLRDYTQCGRGARIHLAKRIPMAAGLAGGSSDAAATLLALNRLWQLGLTTPELAALSAQLGSDIAFFFSPPAAWCTGRGEQVTPLSVGAPLWFVVVSPPVGLSTAAVYRALKVPERPRLGDDMRVALQQGDAVRIGRLLHNRLQEPAEGLCPALVTLRQRLAALQPAGHLLSGSGTSMFALCPNHHEARRIADRLRHDPELVAGSRVFVVRSGS